MVLNCIRVMIPILGELGALPQWIEEPIIRTVPMRDLLVAVDLSGSMDTVDFTNAAGIRLDQDRTAPGYDDFTAEFFTEGPPAVGASTPAPGAEAMVTPPER